MKKIKLLLEFIKLKYQGYDKEQRYLIYVIKGLINFEQYEKLIKLIKEEGEEQWN